MLICSRSHSGKPEMKLVINHKTLYGIFNCCGGACKAGTVLNAEGILKMAQNIGGFCFDFFYLAVQVSNILECDQIQNLRKIM